MMCGCETSFQLQEGEYIQTVPVRLMPNAKTCMGTVRVLSLLSDNEPAILNVVIQEGDGL